MCCFVVEHTFHSSIKYFTIKRTQLKHDSSSPDKSRLLHRNDTAPMTSPDHYVGLDMHLPRDVTAHRRRPQQLWLVHTLPTHWEIDHRSLQIWAILQLFLTAIQRVPDGRKVVELNLKYWSGHHQMHKAVQKPPDTSVICLKFLNICFSAILNSDSNEPSGIAVVILCDEQGWDRRSSLTPQCQLVFSDKHNCKMAQICQCKYK